MYCGVCIHVYIYYSSSMGNQSCYPQIQILCKVGVKKVYFM